jgi:hypothetical protein
MIYYTAVYGGKNPKLAPARKEDGVEHICFIDGSREINAPGWDVRVVKRPEDNFRLQSKWFKLHPHELFPGEKTLWVDGNTRAKEDIKPYFDIIGDNPIGLFRHPLRDCSYAELIKCVEVTADHHDSLLKLNKFLREKCYPGDTGLFVGRTLFRTPASAELNNLWWSIIMKTSSRDQISLPYVLWKLDIKPVILGLWNEDEVPVVKNSKHSFHGTFDSDGHKIKFRSAKNSLDKLDYGRG